MQTTEKDVEDLPEIIQQILQAVDNLLADVEANPNGKNVKVYEIPVKHIHILDELMVELSDFEEDEENE